MDFDISSLLTPEMENKVFAGFEAGEYDVPLVDNVRNGKGTQKLKKDGVEYTLECTWKDGKKNGEGVLLDNNYVMAMKLNFVDDVAEGEGYMYTNGQVTFKGNWKNGLRCGLCQEYEGGHLLYKGEYADDQRNGYGILYDENQEIVFEGQWVNGEQGLISISENEHGDREMTEKKENGCIQYIGGYKEGTLLRDGKGVEYDDDGKPISECIYHEGTVERKIKEFKGTTIVMYDTKGMKVYEGEYLKDTAHRYPPNGKGRLFNGTVMIYNGDFVKGKREGHGCSYHLTRCLQYEGDWMNDMANGIGKYYDDQGNLIVSGEFHDNMFTDENRCIHVDTGVIDDLSKGGCGCFGGNRRAKTKQLSSIYDDEEEEENSSAAAKKAVKNMKELNALPASTTVLTIASDSFNEEDITSLDLYRFEHLRRLVIGDNSLHNLKQLNIREMKYLKSIEIGNRSCSIPELSGKKDKEYTVLANDHCMFIESCPVLEEILLGDEACADFVKFSLIDLPALKTIRLGTADASETAHSNCFYFCEKLLLRDLPALTSVTIGNDCFSFANSIIIKDLPVLTSLTFGSGACKGRENMFDQDTNKIELRCLPELSEFILYSKVFENYCDMKVVEIPNLTDMDKVHLDGSNLSHLKTFKYGDSVPESLISFVKSSCSAKVLQIKKKSA